MKLWAARLNFYIPLVTMLSVAEDGGTAADGYPFAITVLVTIVLGFSAYMFAVKAHRERLYI